VLPPFFTRRLLSSRGDEGDPSPPTFLAATRGYLEQMSPAWIKQRPLLATSKPSLQKPWDLDVAVLPGTGASIGSRRPGSSGDVDLRDEHGRATRENWRRQAKELRATGEGIAREKKPHATRERLYRVDERFLDKNSWVYYFGKCQVINAKHLEMNLFFLWQNV